MTEEEIHKLERYLSTMTDEEVVAYRNMLDAGDERAIIVAGELERRDGPD